jgi:hypothetical protein
MLSINTIFSDLLGIRMICYRLSIIVPVEVKFQWAIWKNKEDY